MSSRKTNLIPHHTVALSQLCENVICGNVALYDIRDALENSTYEMCSNGNCIEAMNVLERLVDFYESMPDRSSIDDKNLAVVFLIIGEIHQYNGCYAQSIPSFDKAAVLDNKNAEIFHYRAESYLQTNDIHMAIENFRQEIALEPGNYFSILRLADLYRQLDDIGKEEECLDRILERSPDNITALHRLIRLYEDYHPEVDVELLRRRLLAVHRDYNEIEMVIRTYHICKENNYSGALAFVNDQLMQTPAITMLHLLKAHICGLTRSIGGKRSALIEFRKSCNNKVPFMDNKLEEFAFVFGEKAMLRLAKILRLSHP